MCRQADILRSQFAVEFPISNDHRGGLPELLTNVRVSFTKVCVSAVFWGIFSQVSLLPDFLYTITINVAC